VLGLYEAGVVVARELEDPSAGHGPGQRPLLAGAHQAVPGGDDHGGGDVDVAGDGSGVVAPERPPGVGDVGGVAPPQLALEPAPVGSQVG
jgi:hypothetical protein